ncbi:hypothetical protein DFH09DRAFT_1078677 [Mycena vulgaris]|nr:hypothetical protein DFH09DRAFT_1078677 [Mycena vulgaris]
MPADKRFGPWRRPDLNSIVEPSISVNRLSTTSERSLAGQKDSSLVLDGVPSSGISQVKETNESKIQQPKRELLEAEQWELRRLPGDTFVEPFSHCEGLKEISGGERRLTIRTPEMTMPFEAVVDPFGKANRPK